MSRHQRLFAAGSWVWIFWGLGHLSFIDLLPNAFDTWLFDIARREETFNAMRKAAVTFLFPGGSNLYLGFWGFSVWMGISLVAVGLLDQVIARSPSLDLVTRRRIYALNACLALVFLVIASTFFFAIPILGGSLALAFFGLAWVDLVRTNPG